MRKVLLYGTLAWISAAEGRKHALAVHRVTGAIGIVALSLLVTAFAWFFSGAIADEYRSFVLLIVFLSVLVPGLAFHAWFMRLAYYGDALGSQEEAQARQARAEAGFPESDSVDEGLWGVAKDPLGAASDAVNAVRRSGHRHR